MRTLPASPSALPSFFRPLLACAAALLFAGTAFGQAASRLSAGDLFDTGYFAWDDGDYIRALDAFESALSAAGGEQYLEAIALTTGERYETVEVANDGTNPRWSSDGRYVSYETTGEDGTTTHIAELTDEGFTTVAEVSAASLSIAADGKTAAFLRIRRGPELEAARTAVREAVEVRTRDDFFRLRREMTEVDASFSDLVVVDLASGDEQLVQLGGLSPHSVVLNPADGSLLVAAADRESAGALGLYAVGVSGSPRLLAGSASFDTSPIVSRDGRFAVYQERDTVRVLDLRDGTTTFVPGTGPILSEDGSTIAFLAPEGNLNRVMTLHPGGEATVAFQASHPLANPALSANGDRVVFQVMERENWELVVASADGSSSALLTRDIQHDLFPRFIDDDTILGIVGEGRHRRSFLYDATTGKSTRLFHNNTIRTVAPEYEWSVSPDGRKILIVSERDGDTISPERGVYLVNLDQPVDLAALRDRLNAMRRSEIRLREFGERIFGPARDRVQRIVDNVSVGRIYSYEKELFSFGSKFITQPGNARAIEYLTTKLESFGYEVEQQWFEPRPGIRSANVIATLPGAVDAELLYVVSSHFDSVERGPGADDNTSGTAALLEAARVLKEHPQSATIKFAFFTGEEAGLLGSREFVRRAVEAGDKLVGALNNDMVGFANDSRLDNTIRYSNDGIRDIQHNAALMFTNLITYDARYYKSTDAHAYYEAYGDIVGGIGSYPILSNPHYHQSHDVLETVNHQLIAEVSKTTVATLVLLASSPSRLTDLKVGRDGNTASVSWAHAVESDVVEYVVTWYAPGEEAQSVTTASTTVSLADIATGTRFEVKAVNSSGMEGWDAARATLN